MAGVVGKGPVVRGVVDALHRQHRPEVVALGGVVVDDVEDDLDAGPVQRLDHPLELADLCAALARGGVAGVRGEETHGAVAPVVGETRAVEEALVGHMVDGEQLHRGDPELHEVVDGGIGGQAGVGASKIGADTGVALGVALHMDLVDHAPRQGRARPLHALPVERIIDHDRPGDGGGVVFVVDLQVGVLAAGDIGQGAGSVVVDAALDGLGVRVDQQLGRVEPVALGRVPRAVDPVAVALTGIHAGELDVPVERLAVHDRHPLLVAVVVEQAELHGRGVLGEQREVGGGPVPGGADGPGAAGPGVTGHQFASGSNHTTPSGGSVLVADVGCPWAAGPSATTPARLATPDPP